MFMLTNGGAMANSTVPDICQTPSPAGPIPIPYPNIAETSMADPGGLVPEVIVAGMPAMNLMSKVTLSNGDQAGANGGVVSAKIMGEMAFVMGSAVVMVGGKPAVRVTSLTDHNGSPPNTVGVVTAPCQTVVMVLE